MSPSIASIGMTGKPADLAVSRRHDETWSPGGEVWRDNDVAPQNRQRLVLQNTEKISARPRAKISRRTTFG
jgi:hypothetical protein